MPLLQEKRGLVRRDAIVDGTIVRVKKAYPVYDEAYPRGIEAINRFLEIVPNLQLAGRNGMHRYNNQDHSMLTGVLAARNVMGVRYDLWLAMSRTTAARATSVTGSDERASVPGRRTYMPRPRRTAGPSFNWRIPEAVT